MEVVLWEALSLVCHMAKGIPASGPYLIEHGVGFAEMEKRERSTLSKGEVLQKRKRNSCLK